MVGLRASRTGMAWLHVDRNKILAAAIHTSESPYARSTAYTLAEMLDVDTNTPVDYRLYNPFTDYDATERHHKKICGELIELLTEKIKPETKDNIFYIEARNQNNELLSGRLTGWCAPGLIAAGDVFEKDPKAIDEAIRTFERENKKMNAEILRNLGQILVTLHQDGEEITLANIAARVQKHDHVLMQDLNAALLFRA